MFQTLDFDDQDVFDKQIKPVAAIQLDSLVLNRKRHLSLESDVAQSEFVAEALFVRSFKKTWPQCTVYFNGGADHTFSQIFVKKFAPCLRVSVVNHT